MNKRLALVPVLAAASIGMASHVSAASPSGCSSTRQGNTGTGICQIVPAGDWYYELIYCKDKGGHAYAAYSSRSYIAWINESVTCDYPYVLISHQVIKSA